MKEITIEQLVAELEKGPEETWDVISQLENGLDPYILVRTLISYPGWAPIILYIMSELTWPRLSSIWRNVVPYLNNDDTNVVFDALGVVHSAASHVDHEEIRGVLKHVRVDTDRIRNEVEGILKIVDQRIT